MGIAVGAQHRARSGRFRMTGGFDSFLALPERDRRDVFEEAASRLDTLPHYVEKDFWVCLVLDALFNWRPEGHPSLLFKGGTSLSKAFGLISRFSEDIDLVVSRDGLGFEGERDPTVASQLSNKKRAKLFNELRSACSGYIRGDLRTALTSRGDEFSVNCQAVPDQATSTDRHSFLTIPLSFSDSILQVGATHRLTKFVWPSRFDWSCTRQFSAVRSDRREDS